MRIAREKNTIVLFSLILLCFLGPMAWTQESSYPFNLKDRDPMMPLVDNNGGILIAKEINADGLSLKGIIYSETRPMAIINDEVLVKGDKLGDYTIIAITETSVSLQKDDKGFVLKLEE